MTISQRGLKIIERWVGKSLVLDVAIMHGTNAFPDFAQYSDSSLEGLRGNKYLFIQIDARH